MLPWPGWEVPNGAPGIETRMSLLYDGGVFWLLNHEFMRQRWDRYQEIYEESHGTTLAPG